MFGRHAGANRHPEVFENPGFRVALAIASLPGMTIELCCKLLKRPAENEKTIPRSQTRLASVVEHSHHGGRAHGRIA
jgi:hypothetical protein